jgi:hypothetical protein
MNRSSSSEKITGRNFALRPPLSYKYGVLPSVRENLSVLTSRAGFMASTPFSVPGKQHSDGGHVLFDRGRCSLALKDFDIWRAFQTGG